MEPNDGFDEDDRWLGMNEEEVAEFIRNLLFLSQLLLWEPPSDPS